MGIFVSRKRITELDKIRRKKRTAGHTPQSFQSGSPSWQDLRSFGSRPRLWNGGRCPFSFAAVLAFLYAGVPKEQLPAPSGPFVKYSYTHRTLFPAQAKIVVLLLAISEVMNRFWILNLRGLFVTAYPDYPIVEFPVSVFVRPEDTICSRDSGNSDGRSEIFAGIQSRNELIPVR